MRTAIAFLSLTFLLSGCVSSKVILDRKTYDPHRRPDYVDYFDYYFLGFKGDRHVNLRTVCQDQRPLAVETVRTVEDGVITFYTLGIYSPLTVRVWCGD